MFDVVIASEPLLITLEKVLELIKQMSWKTGFSIEFFCGNPAKSYLSNKFLLQKSFSFRIFDFFEINVREKAST